MNAPPDSSHPDYRVQTTAVAERFRRLKERPVVLDVDHLTREFQSGNGTVTALRDILSASTAANFSA